VNDASAAAGQPSFELWSVGASASALRASSLTVAPAVVTGGPAAAPVTLAILRDATGSTLARVPADPAQPLDLLLHTPPAITLEGLAIRADGRDAAFIATAGAGASLVGAVELSPRRPARLLTPTAGFTGAQLAYSPNGRVLFAWGTTPTLHAFAESPAGSSRVRPLKGVRGALRFMSR
jgi:hypothetical protein